MTANLAPFRPLDHLLGGDQSARIFGNLTGRRYSSARAWLFDGHNRDTALALRAFRQAGAWDRRESWAAPFVAELQELPMRALDDDLILEHLAADLNDDHWRVAFLNHRDTQSRRMWCRAIGKSHPLNLTMMLALKAEDA